ncbi:MAG: YjbH domain-containing protein, partial [Comamonadaceae bacterium]
MRPPFRLGVLTASVLFAVGASAQPAGSAAPASSSSAVETAAVTEPSLVLPQADLGAVSQIRPGERLSQWLLRQPNGAQAANLGLAWQVNAESFAQRHLKNTLLVELEAWLRQAPTDAQRSQRAQLHAWVESLPVTGRVGLNIAEPRWLEANPTQDPILGADQKLVVSPWPLRTVAVVQPYGTLCHVLHEPGRNVLDYLAACSAGAQADHAWLAQPDGRTFQMNIAAWNAGPVEEPAPGAWL